MRVEEIITPPTVRRTTRTTIAITRRKRWKDIAGISMIAVSVAGAFAMLGYGAHVNNRRAVYELRGAARYLVELPLCFTERSNRCL
jgi:hypothetical protein